jgi:hypothetical protein
MNLKEVIIREIEEAPDSLLDEILDFIRFLKAEKMMETAIMSEFSLKKDWLRPEEDEAWQDL